MLEKAIQELQMITGVITDDFDYLVALLLHKGVEEKKTETRKYVESTSEINIAETRDLGDWFSSLKEV